MTGCSGCISVILASLLALPVIAFGVTTLVADSTSAQLDLESGINSAKGTGTPDNVTEDDGLIKKVVNLLLWAIGIVSVIMIIIGLTALAVPVLLLLAQRAGALDSGLIGAAALPPLAWPALALFPLGAVLVAAGAARFTVLRALGQTL